MRERAAWQRWVARRCSEHAVHARGPARRGVQWQARALAGARAWRRHGSAVVRVRAAASRLGVASPRLRAREHDLEWSGAVRRAAREVVQGEREAGCGSGASGERGRGGRKEEGRERKENGKREKGKKKWEKGKRNRGKENGREGKEKEGGGRCAPAATAAAVGHGGAGHGRWGTRSGGGKEKGEKGKEGAGYAAAGHDTSRWMGKRWDVD